MWPRLRRSSPRNEAGVQFMDGVMFMQANGWMRCAGMTDGSIGELRRIHSAFSFNGGDDFVSGNIRMHSDLEPLGCLGDLGWYNIVLISGPWITPCPRP